MSEVKDEEKTIPVIRIIRYNRKTSPFGKATKPENQRKYNHFKLKKNT